MIGGIIFMETIEKQEIAQRFNTVREFLGVEQKRFAEFLGVSYSTVQKWDQGINPPKAKTLQPLEEKFGISVLWILTGVNNHGKNTMFDEGSAAYNTMKARGFIPPEEADKRLLFETLVDVLTFAEQNRSKEKYGPYALARAFMLALERKAEGETINFDELRPQLKVVEGGKS